MAHEHSVTEHEHHHDAHDHDAHDHPAHDHAHGHGAVTWGTAATATAHCLTGCAIGEVAGMVLATWWGWSTVPSIALSIALAFAFGYTLTMTPVLRAGIPFRRAIGVALAADTVSISVMELSDNGFILAVPKAIDAGLGSALFWWSLLVSLAVAFVITVPVNKYMIARGKGHAVVHEFHSH